MNLFHSEITELCLLLSDFIGFNTIIWWKYVVESQSQQHSPQGSDYAEGEHSCKQSVL